jgi:hypothetical protein
MIVEKLSQQPLTNFKKGIRTVQKRLLKLPPFLLNNASSLESSHRAKRNWTYKCPSHK